MKLTYYGHSCIGVNTAGHDVLFDPFISGNPLAGDIDVARIPATEILISHGHGDHVADAESIAKRTNATLVSNYEIASWFEAKGVKPCIGMNIGGSVNVGPFRVKYVNAVHSSQLPDGTYGGNPGGFVVNGPDGSFHHAGDTALTLDMQLLRPFNLRFACLPIGDHYTMGVSDAIEAAKLMGVTKVVGIHYNTFPPIVIDTEAAKRDFAKESITLLLPGIGETIEI
ncbi:MAG: metal-dependent hydrolase [Flavobacteriales bacterium]|jgi:L-ascorbate metabolism protein UlaG (beta-lactamase superfamily)|nr:metal-dependent hydrolase [Flavobacteriales bacterium]